MRGVARKAETRGRGRRRGGWLALACGLALLSPFGWARFLDGPLGMVPGGPFRGPEFSCAKVDWQNFAAVEELELEVRPERPRSITTWSVVHQGELFVPADFLTPWKRWPEQVLADPRVRIRIGERILRCRAERVDDAPRVEALRATAAQKYDLAPDGRAARSEVWWFRIGPR